MHDGCLPSFNRTMKWVVLRELCRLDWSFLFQVWVIKKNVGKTLESIKIPSTDLKNILDEVRFEDQFTSSRCRGWLILPPQRYLRADILFPGCKFDCRITIRALAGMLTIIIKLFIARTLPTNLDIISL